MSSSKATKIKYTNTYNYPVFLSEYLICEENETRIALFKFYNCLDKKLLEFTFTIEEYDNDNKLIKSSRISVSNTYNPNSLFLPKSKFYLNQNTKYIKYVLNFAKFDSLYYSEGEYIRGKVVLDLKDEEIKPKKVVKPEKINKKDKKTLKNEDFVVMSLDEKYRRNGTKSFIALLSVIILCLSFFLAFAYSKDTGKVHYTTNFYSIGLVLDKANNTCDIVEFDGKADSLVIKESYYNCKVKSIKSFSFENANVNSIFIEGNNNISIESHAFDSAKIKEIKSLSKLSIGFEAFINCKDLLLVDLGEALSVDSLAFSNCISLQCVNLSKASCGYVSFYNCNSLKELFVGSSVTSKFIHIISYDEINIKLESVGYFSQIYAGYFNDLYLYNFTYNDKLDQNHNYFPQAKVYGEPFYGLIYFN